MEDPREAVGDAGLATRRSEGCDAVGPAFLVHGSTRVTLRGEVCGQVRWVMKERAGEGGSEGGRVRKERVS